MQIIAQIMLNYLDTKLELKASCYVLLCCYILYLHLKIEAIID